jgi:hypothetical protein
MRPGSQWLLFGTWPWPMCPVALTNPAGVTFLAGTVNGR